MEDFRVTELLWMAAKSFFICLALTPIVRDIFRSYDVVDQPGHRKVHVYPIPRVGGIAIAVAYAATVLPFSDAPSPLAAYSSLAWKLLPGASLMFAIGLTDDFFNLRPRHKLMGQILAAGLVIWAGVRIESVAGVDLPMAAGVPLTLLWLLVCTNALNLIDGLDGLCAGMGLMAALTMFTAGLISDNWPLVYATFPLAGALLGFLCFNFNPATVFLGDSGALLIGFLLGCYGVISVDKSATLLSITLPLLAISIPLMDVSLSILRRFLRNRPIFSADRGHIHHRLLDRGLTPARAVLVLYLVAALAACFALLLNIPYVGRYRGLVILAFCAAAWLGIRQLRYAEFIHASKLVLGGRFQRVLSGHLEIEQLEEVLKKAPDDDACWAILIDAGRDFGFSRLRWACGPDVREETFGEVSAPCWSMRIPLGESESIELERCVESADSSIDLAAFAGIIHGALAARRSVAVNS